MAITYRDAGVDIDAGSRLVDRIRGHAASTRTPLVLGDLGGFAGLCGLPPGLEEPVLVSGTDGVGTKLCHAFATDRHDTVGIDLVAMCINDVLVTGAQPLFFLDYFATGKLAVDTAAAVVAGIAEGCRRAGCALIGGETAELPGMYKDGEYDLAGFCVAVADRKELRDGSRVVAGDALIGLPSSGLHSNGHSLVRRCLQELGLAYDAAPAQLGGASVADVALEPTVIYTSAFAALRGADVAFHGAAHITGGGLVENPPRMLKGDDLAIALETASWSRQPVFDLVASAGVDEDEMRRTFNLGLGMLIAVAESDAQRAIEALHSADYDARRVGSVVRRSGDAVVFS